MLIKKHKSAIRIRKENERRKILEKLDTINPEDIIKKNKLGKSNSEYSIQTNKIKNKPILEENSNSIFLPGTRTPKELYE